MKAESRERPGDLRLTGSRGAPAAALELVGLYVLVVGFGIWFQAQAHALHAPADVGMLSWLSTSALDALTFSAFVVAGALIVSRRPRNAVGWLMLAAGLARALRLLAGSYASLAIGGSPDDPAALGSVAALGFAALSGLGFQLAIWFLPLLFPDGRLPSQRWRPVLWLMAGAALLWTVGQVASERLVRRVIPLGSDLVETYDIANALAVDPLQPVSSVVTTEAGGLVVGVLLLSGVVALVVRFRRSEGIEHQQMKWFAFAVGLTLSLLVGDLLLRGLLDAPETVILIADGLVLVSVAAFPATIGIAVLRYRLYEIDRLISRTVSYGLVVVILGGVYVGTVVGLGAAVTALTGAEDSDLVVAVSTLAAAGLFRPVRTRIRSAVDRQFNRTGYEARGAVEAFAREVRDEVDLDQIRTRVAETAGVATQPTQVSVWLAPRETST